jgi:hypothetical protein
MDSDLEILHGGYEEEVYMRIPTTIVCQPHTYLPIPHMHPERAGSAEANLPYRRYLSNR